MSVSFTIPEVPVAKGRPQVTFRNGHGHGYTPQKTKLAEWRIREHVRAQLGDTWTPLTGPLALEIGVLLPMLKSIPKSKRDTALPAKRPDLDNYIKTVLDALRDVWVDDAQVVRIAARKEYGSVGCWQITVREIEP